MLSLEVFRSECWLWRFSKPLTAIFAGEAFAFGYDSAGQLGLGIKDEEEKVVATPRLVQSAHLDDFKVVAVSVADQHSAFLAASTSTSAWWTCRAWWWSTGAPLFPAWPHFWHSFMFNFPHFPLFSLKSTHFCCCSRVWNQNKQTLVLVPLFITAIFIIQVGGEVVKTQKKLCTCRVRNKKQRKKVSGQHEHEHYREKH